MQLIVFYFSPLECQNHFLPQGFPPGLIQGETPPPKSAYSIKYPRNAPGVGPIMETGADLGFLVRGSYV